MNLAEETLKYDNARELVLGSRLGLCIETPSQCITQAEFDAFVTACYVDLYELAADDAAFLIQSKLIQGHQAVNVLKSLRTAVQHKDNKQAKSFYEQWLGPEPFDWGKILDRLAAQVVDYVSILNRAVSEVRKSPMLQQNWKDYSAVSVPTIFEAVCRDLDLSFPRHVVRIKMREVESRYRREGRRHSGTKARVIADFCVQEVLSEQALLPVDHTVFLDELGLLGSKDARTAISLAYATAQAHPMLTGPDFSRKVSVLWWALVRS